MIPANNVRLRHVTWELRDAGVSGRPFKWLEGQAVPYDVYEQIGYFLEAHAAGSFDGTTKNGSGKRGLPLLLQHDNRERLPIGHAEKWTHDGGLHGVWRLADTPQAQDAAESIDRGDLGGLSIGFMPIQSEWKRLDWDDWDPSLGPEHMDSVLRTESRLLEVSITPTPAFSDAQVECVRTDESLETRERALPRPQLLVDGWRAWRAGVRSDF